MPRGSSSDATAARELFLYAQGHPQYGLYVENLMKKLHRGVYDHEKAAKLWQYLADRSARMYETGKESHYEGFRFKMNPIPDYFSAATRRRAAVLLRDDFEKGLRAQGWKV